MTLTPEAILKIAKLSRLKLSDADVTYHQDNLNAIFSWIDQLQNVDVSGVSLDINDDIPLMTERADVVTAPNRLTEVLANAPASAHGFFSVPKVVE